MPTYNTVKPEDLIAHCMRFLNEGWGYIYGAFGQIWTQAQQDAKSKTDEQIRLYGQQWVGKHVIDCSGVWYLAMRELGSYMYHGSNTMWNKYTVSKGRLSKGKRTDGKELKLSKDRQMADGNVLYCDDPACDKQDHRFDKSAA